MSNSMTVTRGRPPAPLQTDQNEAHVAARRESWLRYYYDQPAEQAWAKAAKQNSRRRAARGKVEHNLTAQQIENMLPVPLVCPILNVPLTIAQGGHHATAHSATVDRIDPRGGYNVHNCHVISQLANRGKSAMNMAQLIQLGEWAKSHS